MRHVSKWGRALGWLVCACTCAVAAPAQMTLQQALRLKGGAVQESLAHAGDGAPASTMPGTTPSTTEEALHALADQAGVIFVGTVTGVHPQDAVVSVAFHVDEGIRGAISGQAFELREWAGLWAGDDTRYTVGRRLLLLLHAPSAAGLSSPVGGADGAIPIAGDAANGAADLRWVAARVKRSIAVRDDAAEAFAEADAIGPVASAKRTSVSVGEAFRQPAAPITIDSPGGTAWPTDPVGGNVLGQDVHAIDRGLVTGLLRAWTPREQTR